MADEQHWIDLCDPDEQALRAVLPPGIHDTAMDRILDPARAEPRPRLVAQGSYVFGVLAFPAVRADGQVVFQEVDVIATLDMLITVRKTPPGQPRASSTTLATPRCATAHRPVCASTWWSTRSPSASSRWSTGSTTASTSSRTV